jgi:ricin-type beta-trefoil lectin protein
MKIIRSVLGTTAAFLLAIVAVAPPAFAATRSSEAAIPETPTQLVRDYTDLGMCLLGGGQDDDVVTASCAPGDAQQFWQFVPAGDAYQIRNTASGKCLEASGETEGAPVVQASCDADVPHQQWTHDPFATGGGTFRQIILANTSLAISAAADSPAELGERCGCKSQFWSRLQH